MSDQQPSPTISATALEISDEDLLAKLERVKPIVRYSFDEDGKPLRRSRAGVPFYIQHGGSCADRYTLLRWCRRTAYAWDPTPTTRVARPLQERGRFLTLHTFGAPVFFKPSVAEVLAQLPWSVINGRQVAAFEVVGGAEVVTVDGTSYHQAETALYAFKP